MKTPRFATRPAAICVVPVRSEGAGGARRPRCDARRAAASNAWPFPRQRIAAPTDNRRTAAVANVPVRHGEAGRGNEWNAAAKSDRSRTSAAQAAHAADVPNPGAPSCIEVAFDERPDFVLRDMIVGVEAQRVLERGRRRRRVAARRRGSGIPRRPRGGHRRQRMPSRAVAAGGTGRFRRRLRGWLPLSSS